MLNQEIIPPDKKAKVGRPLSSATKLTRKRANEICESGDSPADIMLENMLFWHRAAEGLGEMIQNAIAEADFQSQEGLAQLADLNKLIGRFFTARDKSQGCAVDLAPYVHPRLSAIAFKGDMGSKKLEQIMKDTSPEEAMAIYIASLRDVTPSGPPTSKVGAQDHNEAEVA